MAEALVVDASVAAKWYLVDEEDRRPAIELLTRLASGELDLVAPDSFRPEVASALTAATLGRQPRLTRAEGHQAIIDFLTVAIDIVAAAELIPPAYALVHQHGCALYDALYLALAQNLGIRFITADARLHQRIGHLPEVVWLGDDTPSGA